MEAAARVSNVDAEGEGSRDEKRIERVRLLRRRTALLRQRALWKAGSVV